MTVAWFEDPKRLVDSKKLTWFFPSMSMPVEERVDAATRLVIYYTALLLLVKRDATVLVYMLAALVVLYAFYRYHQSAKLQRETMLDRYNLTPDPVTKRPCFKPTKDNPFMNVSPLSDPADRAPSCDMTKRTVRKQVEKLYEASTVFNVEDVFRRNSGQRQFYSMPATTTPNDQDAFAKWLYLEPRGTCKEDSASCKPAFRTGPR